MATEGVRRRNVVSQETDIQDKKASFDALRHFDVYGKVHSDYVDRRSSGGIVTLVTAAVILFLFWHELHEFITVRIIDSIAVDTRIHQRLHIKVNITFPHLRCDEVSVDAVDSAGDNQVDVHGGIEKVALDGTGHLSGEEPTAKPGDCLPCLEATSEEHKCCNSCQELKDAYTAMDLPYASALDESSQCRHRVGCRIEGAVVVGKVSGNVHVALGKSTVREGRHVHEFNMHDVSEGFNTSHEIHHVGFGDQVPGMSAPLDGTAKIVKHGAYMFHYYIKLVPTIFVDRYSTEVYTNQYSVTDSARNVQVKDGQLSGLPGVFLVYDFSPFLMRKTEKLKPWSFILTSSCALIGGVFSIASLCDKLFKSIYHRVFTSCVPASQTAKGES